MHAQGRSSRFAVSIKTGAVIGLFLLMGAHGARAADAVLSFSASGQRVVTTGQITANDFTAEAWFKLSSYISENQIFRNTATMPVALLSVSRTRSRACSSAAPG